MGVWYRGVWYHGTTPYHHPSSVMIGVVPWYRTSGKTGFGVEKAFKLSKYAKYHLCTYFHFKNHMLSGSSSHHFFWNISSLSNTSNLLARGLYLNVNYPYDCPQTFPELVFDYEIWIYDALIPKNGPKQTTICWRKMKITIHWKASKGICNTLRCVTAMGHSISMNPNQSESIRIEQH